MKFNNEFTFIMVVANTAAETLAQLEYHGYVV